MTWRGKQHRPKGVITRQWKKTENKLTMPGKEQQSFNAVFLRESLFCQATKNQAFP